MADRVGRHVKTPETKEFFKTSEFAVWLLILALLIAGAVIGDNGGGDDNLKGATVWTLVTATSVAYIISRGISKVRHPARPRRRADGLTARASQAVGGGL